MKTVIILFGLLFIKNIIASELNLNSESTFTPSFKNKFSLLLGINPSMAKSDNLKNFHFAYGRNLNENFWWDFNVSMTKGYLNHFTTNNYSATKLSSTNFNTDNNSSHLALGLGINYDTHYIRYIIPFENLYENIGTSITYNNFKDSSGSYTFNGPGLLAKYSLISKVNEYISFGGNFTYNLAVVKRSQLIDSENSSNRSLTLSYLTIGLDLSIFL